MNEFDLNILSFSGVIFTGKVISLNLDTLQCGMVSILSDHENFVATLKDPGKIVLTISNEEIKEFKFNGLSSVNFNSFGCTVFAEFCNV